MKSISQKDDKGNMIYSKGNEILLYIAPLQTVRKLCKVKDGEVEITRKNKHIFRKMDAYGFNYELMKILGDDTIIRLKQEDKSILSTTVRNVLQKGQILNFGMQGFERQIFLSRTDFTL